MAILRKADLIREYNARQATVYSEQVERSIARDRLRKSAQDFSSASAYDMFLSHSYNDARAIQALRDLLKEAGFTVYVDWIDDSQLDRERVTPETAAILRERMNRCTALLYATSESATKWLGCLGSLAIWTPDPGVWQSLP